MMALIAMSSFMEPHSIHVDVLPRRHSTVFSVATAPSRAAAVTIRSEPWPEVQQSKVHQSTRHVYLSAVMSAFGHVTYVGGAGMQLISVDADGQNQFIDAPGKKLRAVVTGTLHVYPAWRRQGVAQRVLSELEGRALRWGQSELLLVVNTQNNAAIRLYEKMGYTRTPGTPTALSGEVCMRRNLLSPTMHTLRSMLPQVTTVILY